MTTDIDAILPAIKNRAVASDQSGNWPTQDLADLAVTGAMRWAVPADAGGDDLSAVQLHERYEQIAAASLSTALILSQRDSAVGLIDGSTNLLLRARLLERLVNNTAFATVGIAQLTTSRQGGTPALLATPVADGYRLDGIIPWATGADRCDFIIAACSIVGGDQILFALSTSELAVTIDPPTSLVALSASRTTSIRCDAAHLNAADVLAGPMPRVLSLRRKGLPVGQCFLALGLCRSALVLIGEHRSERAAAIAEAFDAQLSTLRLQVLEYSRASNPDSLLSPQLRGDCNDLAVRLTHAAVALYKGTALRTDHPAQRLAREAMFLLVWSCPDPVIDCTMERLAARQNQRPITA